MVDTDISGILRIEFNESVPSSSDFNITLDPSYIATLGPMSYTSGGFVWEGVLIRTPNMNKLGNKLDLSYNGIKNTANLVFDAVENSELINVPQSPPKIRTKRFITKSICYHAALLANDISAKAVSTLTNSGYTAFQISAWRPQSHILVFTSNKRILNQLSLLWGVKTFYYDNFKSTDKTIEEINDIAEEKGYVEKDDFVINLTAMPIKSKGMVNTLRVTTI